MKFKIDFSPKSYIQSLRLQFDSPLQLFWERYTGFCIGRFFSVNYSAGKEFGKRYDFSMQRALGIFYQRGDVAEVWFHIFPGYSDPISMLCYFLITVILFAVIGVPNAALFAGLTSAFVAGVSGTLCTFTEDGEKGKRNLKEFLMRIKPFENTEIERNKTR